MPPQTSDTGVQPIMVVVEDDEDDFYLLNRALSMAGSAASVYWARDVQEALLILAEVDKTASTICVVVDVQLAGCSGLDLLDQMGRLIFRSKLRTALLTGLTDQRTQDAAISRGVDAFFLKSIEGDELLRVARELHWLASR